MLVSGREVYTKAVNKLQDPNATSQDFTNVFHDFNLLLDTSLIEDDPQIATIWFHVGSAAMKKGYRALALLCFNEALKSRPDFLEAINNIGYIYKKLNFHSEAAENFKKIVDLVESNDEKFKTTDQNKAEFYTNYGSMFVANGTPDKAIEYFDKAHSIWPHQRLNTYNKGLSQLEKGEYEEGFKGYDEGDRIDRIVNRHYGYQSLPIWDGTPGKNVVVVGEQGIGDELMFATILPDISNDCSIVLDAHPRLADMFRRSFKNLDVYGTRKDDKYFWGKRYPLDAKVLIGSLPKYYRKKEEDFPRTPYLVVDEKFDKRYQEKLRMMGERPKIGISWRGGTKQTGRSNRYIPMEMWLDILKFDFDFISLQYDTGILPEIEEFNQKHGVKIHHWPECMEDYEQTAALVKNLDLVVSVPQSVIHLAGVLGTFALQLCPYKTLWQCGEHGKNMPWYSCVQNLWQDESCDWQPVMEKVKDELCSLFQMNTEN